ncbi:MAG: type II secretion system protein [Patescibacteria group bacterium]
MSSLSLIFSKGTLPRAQSRGFTLVEMMVVVSIIIIMTGVVLAGLPGFRDRSSLDLVAQEVALVIRQAQAFGSQTRGAFFGSNSPFPSYGVYINLSQGGIQPSANSFVLFGDNKNTGTTKTFDLAGGICGVVNSECREVYNLSGGLVFTKVQLCESAGACQDISNTTPLNILFNRPNPEAAFNNGSGNSLDSSCTGGVCSYAKITLSSAKTNTVKNICVWSTGHIYVTSNLTC